MSCNIRIVNTEHTSDPFPNGIVLIPPENGCVKNVQKEITFALIWIITKIYPDRIAKLDHQKCKTIFQ